MRLAVGLLAIELTRRRVGRSDESVRSSRRRARPRPAEQAARGRASQAARRSRERSPRDDVVVEGDYPCKMPWRGIRCEGGNGVTHIEMSNRGLSGHIDPAIGLIETLQVLDLGNNSSFTKSPARP